MLNLQQQIHNICWLIVGTSNESCLLWHQTDAILTEANNFVSKIESSIEEVMGFLFFFSQGHLLLKSHRKMGTNCSSPLNNQSLLLFKMWVSSEQTKKHHLLNEAKHYNRFNDVDLSSNSCFEITTNH